jgi:tRNA-2-methylthio-N6-dimethylallyladenosine synthase
VPPREAQERLVELQALQRWLTLSYHQSRVGQASEVLIEGPSRRGVQLQGRDPQHRVVNVVGSAAEPGALLPIRIVAATPHSLVAETERAGELLKPLAPLADEQGRAQTFTGAE